MPRPRKSATATATPSAAPAFVAPAPAPAPVPQQSAILASLTKDVARLPKASELSWDDLPPAETVEYTRAASAGYSLDETPMIVREKLRESYAQYDATKPLANRKSQECGSTERAKVFEKALRRYAANLESDPMWASVGIKRLTVRGGVDKERPTRVTYSVRPFEPHNQ